ncbi:MAG: TonB-dependent receptor [Proteobacteria bacterium]|nr:TonB-dependent receptor [Pseudomonadota bacterium]
MAAIVSLASPANAAEPTPPVPAGAVTAPYPSAAMQRGLHGDVVLDVDVDASGRVGRVEVVEGHPVLAQAAIDAVQTLRFKPARDADGAAVAGRTRVTYSFAPHPGEVYEVIEVVGVREEPDDEPRAVTSLDEEALRRNRGRDLAETLEDVPGVVMARGVASVGKPVIRGQPERRLLLVEGGVRHENQKWGVDHAPEIDPSGAGTIRVLKGPAGVLHGPDAVGGVILIEPRPMPYLPGFDGSVDLVFHANEPAVYGGARLEGMPAAVRGLSFRLEGNYAHGGPQNTPDYVLGNTASQQWNLRAAVQYRNPRVQATLRYRHFDLRAGVFYGVRNSTPTDFRSQLEAESPTGTELWKEDWNWERPYQAVAHDQVTGEVRVQLPAAGSLEARYSFQHNHRHEFEQARRSVEGPQYDFRLRTHTVDAVWEQPGATIGVATGSGQVGVAGLFQEHVYEGLTLLPNHRSGGIGVFALERLTFPLGVIEAGARYDHLSRSAFFNRNPYERHLSRGTLEPEQCEVGDGRTRCPTAFHGGAVAVGGVLHAVPGTLDLKLDLSSASRFPNTDELYLNGGSPTFPVYALGRPDLGVETAWGLSPTLGLTRPWLHLEVSGHLTRIDDYIYFAPELNDNGAPHIDVTVRGAFPRYSYRAIDSVFYGVDGHVEIGPEAVVGLVLSGSVVRGQNLADGDHLIGVPPDRLRIAGRLQPKKLGPFEDFLLEANVLFVGTVRNRLEPDADLAPAPHAYTLVGGAIGTTLPLKGLRLSVHIEVHNLLNTAYRETLSLLRYYADEPGRDVRVRVGFDF